MTIFIRTICLLGLMSFMVATFPVGAAEQDHQVSADTSGTPPAQNALSLLLSAFAVGDQHEAEKLIDPQMIGYSRVMNGVQGVGNLYKQVHVSLSDVHTQMAEDVVIIQAQWDMRSVQVSTRAPSRRSGTCIFVMRHIGGSWKLSALSGDNPFGLD
jgi:hypothetical protein